MSNNIRLRYALFLGAAATAVTAVPLDRREAEENSSSLNRAVEDAVHLDNDIKAERDEVEDDDDESDDELEDEDDDDDDNAGRNDSRNRPPISSTVSVSVSVSLPSPTTTALADTLPVTTATTTPTPTAIPTAIPSSTNTHNRSAAIAGGTIGGLLILALIAFLLYRFRKARPSPVVYADEKHPYPYPAAPPSTLFGGGSSQRTAAPSLAPTMPKPPPLVFINPPTHNVDAGTFYRPETTITNNNNNNNNTTTTTEPLPPVYEELRSPGMESSISQTAPYPEKAAARKLYASFGPPPEPPVAQVSRFSWTTRRSSLDSEEPKFRSVNSWVSNQAGRNGVKEKLAQMGLKGEVPATPVEFRFHPGAPVQFGAAGHGRMESEDLDRQLQMSLRR